MVRIVRGNGALTAVSLVLAAAAFTSPARAQSTQTETVVDDLVVTARKREESVTNVPAAISTITSEDRESLVLDGTKDYLRQMPSTSLVSSGPEYLQDIAIRGQGSGRLGFSEAATGLYKDGLYNAGGGFGGRSLTRMDLLDYDRIEVLRGPQGALYGRNSVGGAVNIVSHAPDSDFGGRVLLRYSDPERTAIEGVLNLPIIDDVFAIRLAGFNDDQQAGFIRNVTTGHDLDVQTFQGYRLAARWTPSDMTTVDFLYERYESDTPSFTSLGRKPLRSDSTVLDPSPWIRVSLDREGRADILEDSFYLTFTQDLGFADLVIKASTKTRDAGRTNEDNDHFAGHSDIDVAPGATVLTPDYTIDQFEEYSRTVAQAYLVSNGEGRANWLIGVEYLATQDEVLVDPRLCPTYTGVAQPITTGCIVGQAGTLTGVPLSVRTAARLGLNHDEFTEELTSPSLFASFDIDITPNWSLGLEARLQKDTKDVTFVRYSEDPLVYFGTAAVPTGLMAPSQTDPDGALGPMVAAPVQFCPPTLAAANCRADLVTVDVAEKREWTFFTPTITLRRSLQSGGSIYARFATGYRPGGFNTNMPATTVRSLIAPQLLYDPEYAYSYELGAKGRWKGVRFTAAVFYNWTNNVQVVSAPSRGFILQNAGDAWVTGYEIEARKVFEVGSGDLAVSLALSGQKGEFEEGATALIDLDGDGISDNAPLGGFEVPRMRDYQVSLNVGYGFPLPGGMAGFVSGGMQMADGGYENANNSRTYDGYTLFDARAGVKRGDLRLSVFARNLGDQTSVVQVVNTNEFQSEPRVVGVELSLNF